MPPSLLAVTTFYDELIGSVLLLAGLISESRLAPRGNGSRTTDGRFAFTTAVRVVAGVHDGTADGRSDTHVTLLAGFTDLDSVVLDVADLTDRCEAVHTDVANFAGGKSDLSHIALFCHELRLSAGGSYKLTALAGIKLDVVDERTYGDICERKRVAGFDIGVSARVENVAVGYADGSHDVALVALIVLKKGDVSRSVRVVLDTDDRRLRALALEVDDTVILIVSAALVANGDPAVAVSSGMFLLDLYKRLFRREFCKFLKEGTVISLLAGVVGLYFTVGII